MAHQRAPAPGDQPEDDVNDFFFDALQDPLADRPDVLIMSMGAHEVFGWSGRPRVKLNLTVYKEDTEELLGKVLGSFPEQRVIWWKAHYIQQGLIKGEQLFNIRRYHSRYHHHHIADHFAALCSSIPLFLPTPHRQDQGRAIVQHSSVPQLLPPTPRCRPLCCLVLNTPLSSPPPSRYPPSPLSIGRQD
ncbi:unnamed protein product [Closterium sp. NIES-64]|nr:unnamed protein product [Closterium sp. NIES-64]